MRDYRLVNRRRLLQTAAWLAAISRHLTSSGSSDGSCDRTSAAMPVTTAAACEGSKVGVAAARELFLTGERFDAARALEIGLVDRVGTAEDAEEEPPPVILAQELRKLTGLRATSWWG